MREPAEFTVQEGEAGATIALRGSLTIDCAGPLDDQLRQLAGPIAVVDLTDVTTIDTVGAWAAWRLARDHQAQLAGVGPKTRRLIDAVSQSTGECDIMPVRQPLPERVAVAVGDGVIGWSQGTVQIIGFMGAILVAFWHVTRHPSRFRGTALVRQLELVGITAIGIIGLMSFLVGIVIAQQGAAQLQQFGAEVYTVNLTGRLAMRELGVLMTAIMVAGRSGSAFAAQIGTMRLTEEVDAMRTIGVSPAEALVLPRVLAAVFMMPLLGFYAAVVSIIGGAFLANFALDMPFFNFLYRVREVVPLHDVWVGLIKAPFFGIIIALSGCYQGMQVKANAEEVGLRTTMAVVQGIFMVIVLDAFFAVFFTKVGWG